MRVDDSVRTLRRHAQRAMAASPRVRGGVPGDGCVHRGQRGRHSAHSAVRASADAARWHRRRVYPSAPHFYLALLTPTRRLAPIVYDALLLVLTVRRCTRGLRHRAPLLELLFRDGLWAFLVIFGAPLRLCGRPRRLICVRRNICSPGDVLWHYPRAARVRGVVVRHGACARLGYSADRA
jgi:hypothetical protein